MKGNKTVITSKLCLIVLSLGLSVFLSSTVLAEGIARVPSENNPFIVSYSRSGNTRMVARALQEQLAIEMTEIKSKKNRNGFFGIMTCVLDQLLDREDEQEPFARNLSQYNPLLLCTPNWMGKLSSPMRTFIKQTNIKGKDAYFFVTYSGRLTDEKVVGMKEWATAQGLTVKDIFKIVSAKKTQEDIDKEVEEIFKGLAIGKKRTGAM